MVAEITQCPAPLQVKMLFNMDPELIEFVFQVAVSVTLHWFW